MQAEIQELAAQGQRGDAEVQRLAAQIAEQQRALDSALATLVQARDDEAARQDDYRQLLSGQSEAGLRERWQHLHERGGRLTQLQDLQRQRSQLAAELARLDASRVELADRQGQDEARRQDLLERFRTLRTGIADQEKLLEQERRIQALEAYRAQLQPGEACPLCGSHEHPAIASYQALDVPHTEQRLQALRAEQEQVREQGEAVRDALTVLTTQQHQLEQQRERLQQQRDEQDAQWQRLCVDLALAAETLDLAALLQGHGAELSALQEQLAALEQARAALEAARERRQAGEQACAERDRQLALLRQQRDNRQGQQAELRERQAQRQAEWQSDSAQLAAALAELGHALPDDENAWLQARDAEWQAWQRDERRQRELEPQRGASAAELTAAGQVAVRWQQRWAEWGLAERPTPAFDDAAAQLRRAETDLLAAEQRVQALHGRQLSLKEQAERQREQLRSAELAWAQALAASPFADAAGFLAALLDDQQRTALAELRRRLDKASTEAQALLQAAEAEERQLSAAPSAIGDRAQLEGEWMALGEQLRQVGQRQGEIRAQLQGDDQRRQNQQALFAEIERQGGEYDLWQRLNGLIGSADGAKYRKFAQGLTLDHLIHLANRQLQRLHGRYQLARRSGGELELEVIDTWQADVARDCRTLSGGESFLVSLALALALSDLVSHKTSIDSLFLDEGFGTLDGETLEVALDALDTLNASGKMIGVISHVEALKERIPVQLKVHKGVGMGYSRLEARFAVGP
ncbi:Nuclease SbcCD subunit C [compost metagenome]